MDGQTIFVIAKKPQTVMLIMFICKFAADLPGYSCLRQCRKHYSIYHSIMTKKSENIIYENPHPKESTPLGGPFRLYFAKTEGLYLSLRLTCHNYQNLHVRSSKCILFNFDFLILLLKCMCHLITP